MTTVVMESSFVSMQGNKSGERTYPCGVPVEDKGALIFWDLLCLA